MISIVINADTRPGIQESESTATRMFDGCRSIDFLVEGVKNKINFFEGHEKEVIMFIDEHETVPSSILSDLTGLVDKLMVRRHTSEHHFNDFNYLSALKMATGDIIAHFDQDCCAFAKKDAAVPLQLISLLDMFAYVSYPSLHSPHAVNDPSFDYDWVSTRFFMCKRSVLDFEEITRGLNEYEWFYNKYPASRKCHWLEHILGLIAKYRDQHIFYPELNLKSYAIFCWNKYKGSTMETLNAMNYDEVKHYIDRAGGISYPNDLTAI